MYEFPEHLDEYQRILGIPIKKAPQKDVNATEILGQIPVKKWATLIFQSCMMMLSKYYRTGGKEVIKMAQLEHIKQMQRNFTLPYFS